MDLRLALAIGLAVTALLLVGFVMFCLLAMGDDEPPPPDAEFCDRALLQAHVERAEALQRIADRQNHEQRQRDASARLTRGW